MLLFLTRDAFCSLSIEDRRVGDGDASLPPKKVFSELKRAGVDGDFGSRPCQKRRGEELPSAETLNGDDWNGDESILIGSFCALSNEHLYLREGQNV